MGASPRLTADALVLVLLLVVWLQSLLSESNFKPRKLKKDKKSQLVDAIKAMEESYPADANPLADPALSGQWSVVYSSSSRVRLSSSPLYKIVPVQ